MLKKVDACDEEYRQNNVLTLKEMEPTWKTIKFCSSIKAEVASVQFCAGKLAFVFFTLPPKLPESDFFRSK